MALQHILLQKLQRTQHNGDITLHSREQSNRSDGPVYSLFEQARNAMQRSAAKQIGSFDHSSEHGQLIGLINNWQAGSIDFTGFAKRAAQLLQQQLMPTEEPFTAMLLVALETLAGQHYLHLLWLPEQDIITTGSDLEPIAGRMIAADKITYGLNLNLSEWQQDGDASTCLTLLSSRGNKPFSEAFIRFAAFTQRVDSPRQTSEFLAIVDRFSEQLPAEQSQPVKASILDYCVSQDKIGQPVSVKALSARLNEQQPEQFIHFVSEQQQTPQDTVYTHRPSLKRYMRYFGRDHSMSISFSAERIDQDILYDAASGTLHIKKLPKNLKQQLSSAEKDTQDEQGSL